MILFLCSLGLMGFVIGRVADSGLVLKREDLRFTESIVLISSIVVLSVIISISLMLILEEFCIKSKYEILKIGEQNIKKEKEKF